jgi:C_GCAxxG_C_C family probable redox protein
LKAYSEYKNIDCSQLISATTAFGSGLNSGCVCGSLAGAEMLIGVIHANDPKTAREKSRMMHDKFREKFGATCCRIIRGKENGICAKTIEFAIESVDLI